MTELSKSMHTLIDAYTDWDAKYGADVKVLEGLFYATACTTLDDEATDTAMAARPATATRGWTRSKDATFDGGEPNPCPCEQEPNARRHVLYEA